MTDPARPSDPSEQPVPPAPPAPAQTGAGQPVNPPPAAGAPGHALPPQPAQAAPLAPSLGAPPPPAPGTPPPPAPGKPPPAPGGAYDPVHPGGYAAPAQPGYPQPGAYPAQPGAYPAQPGAYPAHPGAYPAHPGGYPGYGQPPKKGTLSWALGLLIALPIPFLSAIASGVAMAVPYGAAKRHPSPAPENARNAANWAITFLLISTGLLVLHFVVLILVTGAGETSGGFFPLGIPITLYVLVCLAHFVIVIVGTIVSSQGRVMRMPAIPFLRG